MVWRCLYCGDGPFKDEILSKENILHGQTFCMWCIKHADQESLEEVSKNPHSR